MRDNEKEDARKRGGGGGADKRGGGAFTIPILSMWKNRGGGGGRINDGGRSGGTLRYMYLYTCTQCTCTILAGMTQREHLSKSTINT